MSKKLVWYKTEMGNLACFNPKYLVRAVRMMDGIGERSDHGMMITLSTGERIFIGEWGVKDLMEALGELND